jgi:hypothetical protein
VDTKINMECILCALPLTMTHIWDLSAHEIFWIGQDIDGCRFALQLYQLRLFGYIPDCTRIIRLGLK